MRETRSRRLETPGKRVELALVVVAAVQVDVVPPMRSMA